MTTPHFHPTYRIRPIESGKPRISDWVSSDLTRTRTYRITSIGGRGEEYDPSALRRLYVFGCSMTFGVGLREEEVWCHHFANRYATHLGLARRDLNLMNFSSSGASNQEIARNVMLQCAAKKPDYAIAQFTFPDRWEHGFGEEIAYIGNWTPAASWEPQQVCEAAADQYLHYTHEQGCLDMMRQILTAQNYFIANRIDYMIAVAWGPEVMTPLGKALYRLVDHRRVLWLPSIFRRMAKAGEFCALTAPRAVDGTHFGASTHAKAAEVMWKRYLRLHPSGLAC